MLTVAAGMRAAIGSTSFRRRFKQSARADAYKRETFARLVRREVEQVPAVQLEGRISAVQVVPYPTGIPLLKTGRRIPGSPNS